MVEMEMSGEGILDDDVTFAEGARAGGAAPAKKGRGRKKAAGKRGKPAKKPSRKPAKKPAKRAAKGAAKKAAGRAKKPAKRAKR